MKASRIADTTVTYIILIAVCFIFFFPCLWLILASFSKSGSIYSFDGFFPSSYSLDTFKMLFTDTAMYNYPQWFRNTLFIATMSCLIGTFLTVLTAYTMSRFQFKSRKAMMKTTLILGMFPSFMGMIAVYIIMTQFGLINKMWGLILIYSANAPMGYLTQKGFFDTIPSSILLKLLLKEKNLYTVAVGLMSLGDTEFARFAAGAVFIAVPIVILYFCLVKFMVNGMTAGAVKG